MSGFKGALAVVALAALTACGGGGGGSTVSAPELTVQGQAAKGLMANADVAVYTVGADGQIAATPLTTATTDSAGKYELKFTAVKGQPFVIKVSAKSDGSTTHLDEVTGQPQPLPSGFSMRALLLPETDGQTSTSVSVTPFSEMAVSAASKANGGITAANARQANSTVEQLLGFNPTAVSVVSANDATATPEQQKLAVMLTAVSQMASDGDLGCGAAASKTQCVVENLAKSTSTTSMELASGASSALQQATQTVLNKPELVGAISASTLGNIVTNLGCKDDSCRVSSTPVGPDPVAVAITSAKLLFTQIKTDLTSMFSQDGISANSVGSVNQEAFKFKTAMTGIQAPVDMATRDVRAITMGIGLYNDFKSGSTTIPQRWSQHGQCTLYQDMAYQVVATEDVNARYIRCDSRLGWGWSSTNTDNTYAYTSIEKSHRFYITPSADNGFAYDSKAWKRIMTTTWSANSSSSSQTSDDKVPGVFSGSVILTRTNDLVTGIAIKGELPAAFNNGDATLANYKSAVDLSGTLTLSANTLTALSLTGSVTGYKDSSNQESLLTIKNGIINLNGVDIRSASINSADVKSADLNVVWNTGAAEFEGDFAFAGVTADKSGTKTVPTQLSLKGMLRNIASGVSTEFLSGNFRADVTGYGDFDATLPLSASNKFTGTMQFVGAVTAPSRPKLELNLGAGVVYDGFNTPLPLTLQYRTLVNGTPRNVVTLTGTPSAPGAPTAFKLAEATSGLSMSWSEGASETDLVFGNPVVKVGTVKKNGMVYFTDGQFMSLDLGL